MEEIIAHLLAEMAKKICEMTFSLDWSGIGDLTERLKDECLTTEKAILEECLEAVLAGLPAGRLPDRKHSRAKEQLPLCFAHGKGKLRDAVLF